MSRVRGIFDLAGNYEPLIAAPFDARQLVDTVSDLTKVATWAQEEGGPYIYKGMLVVVANDTPINNGLYLLTDVNNYTSSTAWEKLGSGGGSGDSYLYRIVEDEETQYKWHLEESRDKGTTWSKVTGSDVDVSALSAEITKHTLEILPVSAYGFNTNLRVNQQVDGSALVDKVIYATNVDKKQVIIKSGDYKYNVVSILEDLTDIYKGFVVETMNLDPTDFNAEPALEKGIFLYIPALGKTCTFYGKQYTNKEIDAVVQQITTQLQNIGTQLANRTIQKITNSDGSFAQIFNESDGGGAHFTQANGAESYVGVADGSGDGLMAQIYADTKENGNWVGSRINVYNNKIYYTNKEDVKAGVARNDSDHEIATKGDVKSASAAQWEPISEE